MSSLKTAQNRDGLRGICAKIRYNSAKDSFCGKRSSVIDIHRNLADEPTGKGFSLLEFLMAVFVLMIGLGGVLALFMHTMVAMTYAEESLIAKQKAREALESIFTARNTQQVTFDQVRNVGSGTTGIFLTGLLPLTTPGADGLVGTADDGSVEAMVMPDGTTRTLNEFERQIQITNLTDDVRQITVTIRYAAPRGWFRNYQVSTYISRFR
jgi:type II secretory pathway pseudopilin PulG